jgi:nucleoside-diphosphate-sugar epimerase
MLPKKILITGASGFIGRSLARRLQSSGVEIHGTSREEQPNGDVPVIWHQGSFQDVIFARNIITSVKPDVIYHLSGMVTGNNHVDNVIPTYHSLVTSTVNLLSAAATVGCCQRIIIVGSSNEPVDDSPNSPYAAAKWASSMYSRLFQTLYNLPIVIARTFVVYGPGQPSDKLIPYVMTQLMKGERPKLSSGTWKTDWIYIDDAVEALTRCAVMPGIEGCTIDIGTGEYASVRDIVDRIVAILEPSTTPQFGALPDRHAEHTPVADTAYTREKLRWKPEINLAEGLKRTVEYATNLVAGKPYLKSFLQSLS